MRKIRSIEDLKVGDKFVVASEKVRGYWNPNGKMDCFLGTTLTVEAKGSDWVGASECIRWSWRNNMINWGATEKLNNGVKQNTTQINDKIQRVIQNGNATIVFFTSGNKQVVRHTDGEYDLEKAVCVAIAKEYMGGYTGIKEVLDSLEEDVVNCPIATVINYGCCYSTYTDFFKENNMRKYESNYVMAEGFFYNYEEAMRSGTKVSVLEQVAYYDKVMCVVQPIGTNKIYLITSDGLKFD